MFYGVASGALMICCLVAGLFFLKFWRKTQDRLFMFFSMSFFMLSFERLVLVCLGTRNEPTPYIYLIRLGAFILIIYAIINKNRSTSSAGKT
jgi:Ca2+/Na+ antiporter